MDMITVTAKIVDEAVTKALVELEITSDKLKYEVVDKRSTRFLGIGAKPAITRAKEKESIGDKAMDFLSRTFGTTNMQVNIIAACDQEEQEPSLNLEGEDMGISIGKRGQTLDSLQYLVSLVVNKGTEEYLRMKLDAENYRERRKGTLETLVKNIAYKAKRTKRPAPLEPMNPYEGGIVHVAPQNDKYVTTRGEGEEPFYHMAIALKREVVFGGRKGHYDRSKEGHSKRSDRFGGYRSNRRTNRDSAPRTGSDASAETVAGGGE